MIRTTTDKYILDKVPTSIEMCFHTITNAGSTLENERGRETHARSKFQHKVDRSGGIKQKKEDNKPLQATKKDDTKRV